VIELSSKQERRAADLVSMAESIKGIFSLDYQREWRFHPTRRWRFDLAFPEISVALEVEGGAWSGGRHTRPMGFLGDMDKYNEAVLMGWLLLRCTWKEVKNGEAQILLERAIKLRLGVVDA
jgi:hypothetical protein